MCLEKAFDEDGKLKQPKQLSINKVGHGMSSNGKLYYLRFSCLFLSIMLPLFTELAVYLLIGFDYFEVPFLMSLQHYMKIPFSKSSLPQRIFQACSQV